MNADSFQSRQRRVRPGASWASAAEWLSRSLLLSLPILGLLLAGCATGDPSSPKQTALGGVSTYPKDVLREGDTLSITCESVTNINTVAKIPLNGMLDLPFIGQVQASGKTTRQLQEDLLQLYSSQVRADVITVKLLASASAVYVVGAVLQPGKIPMDRPMTVLDAVMEAGGYDPNRARLSKVRVLRREGGQQVAYEINVSKIISGQDPTPFYLQPFDTVQVPARTINW